MPSQTHEWALGVSIRSSFFLSSKKIGFYCGGLVSNVVDRVLAKIASIQRGQSCSYPGVEFVSRVLLMEYMFYLR